MTERVSDFELGAIFDKVFDIKDGIRTSKMLIAGKWVSSEKRETFDVKTPIDGSIIFRAQMATPNDVNQAIVSAYEFRRIRDLPAIERIEIFDRTADILEQYEDALVTVLELEAGKTIRDAEGEVSAAIHRLKLTMEEARKSMGEYLPGDWSNGTVDRMALVIREPVGVVAAITPFNYPLLMAATKIIPALLAGNSVVVKPSSSNPISAILLVKALDEAGLPEGCLNILTGKGEAVGDILITHPKVDMINFTGSTPIGQRISTMAGMKRLHLELGGKAYALVLEDADLDLAAERCVFGSLKFAGQRCDAVSSILAIESIADSLSMKIVKEVDQWKMGDPRDRSVWVGPLINPSAAQKINELVTDALDRGAELLRGGKCYEAYYEPTVLDNVPTHARIAYEEVFGPVVTIIRIRDENEALNFAKKSRYGLESCVFTKDFYRMWRVAKSLECGEVTINDCPSHGVGYFPFGGIKDSGMGREGIGYSIDEMTNLKTIVFNLAAGAFGKRL
jgi:glyceraldehyde-3-phosphate dehydrogenase [NAD(P)+]